MPAGQQSITIYTGVEESESLDFRTVLCEEFGNSNLKFIAIGQSKGRAERWDVKRATAVVSFTTEEKLSPRFREDLAWIRKVDPTIPVVMRGHGDTSPDSPLRYVDPTTELRDFASAVWSFIQPCCWRGTSHVEVPALAVGVSGTIVQANQHALERFGEGLVGRDYAGAVEHSPGLSKKHPISLVFATGHGHNARRRLRVDQKEHICSLICRPIVGLDGKTVEAVAVLVLEATQAPKPSPRPQISGALQRLTEATTLQGLYRAIVEGARGLGYQRARLKQFDEKQNKLFGLECDGFETRELSERFRSFVIDLDADSWAGEAMESALPLLFVYDADQAQAVNNLGRSGLRRYCDELRHETELHKSGVSRWIDAPLLIDSGGRSVPEKWGVLTVDQGQESDSLDESDAAYVALFAQHASLRIQSLKRSLYSDQELSARVPIRLIERLAGYFKSDPNTRILPQVVKVLLDYFMENCPVADVAYYREFHEDALVLLPYESGETLVCWRSGTPPTDVRVPLRVERGQGFSARLLEKTDPDSGGRIRKGEELRTEIFNDTREATEQLLAQPTSTRWSKEEIAFLRYQSAVYAPLGLGGRLRGVFVGVSKARNVFLPDVRLFVDRFRKLAEFCVELAEMHDSQLWWDENLHQVLDALPYLTAAPLLDSDEGFFAGLATLLTSGDGLGWHRAFLFRRDPLSPDRMQLVYAVGGLGKVETHTLRQKEVHRTWKGELARLVELRCRTPRPIGKDNTLDPLYQLCVEDPRAACRPLWIARSGTESLPAEVSEQTRQLAYEHPFAHILSNIFEAKYWDAVPVFRSEEAWIRNMNAKYRDMFCSPMVYAYPLWCVKPDRKELYGLVLVDTAYWPSARPTGTHKATHVVLELATNILASRLGTELPLFEPEESETGVDGESAQKPQGRRGSGYQLLVASNHEQEMLAAAREAAEYNGFVVAMAATEKEAHSAILEADAPFDLAVVAFVSDNENDDLEACVRTIRTLRIFNPLCRILGVHHEADHEDSRFVKDLMEAGAHEVIALHPPSAQREELSAEAVLPWIMDFWKSVLDEFHTRHRNGTRSALAAGPQTAVVDSPGR